MGVMPVKKLLVKISLPIMISMLVQALYNIVDSIFVGQFSDKAFTAVSLAFPLQMLVISVAVGTGVGVNSLLSRRLGEKRPKQAAKVAANGIFLALISAVVFAVVGMTCSRTFFEAFSQDADIVRMGTEYLTICITFSISVFMQITFERIMQGTGLTIYNMVIQLTGAIINIILDPILIFGYLGFPQMGIAGAAIATVIGQTVAMALGWYFTKKKVKEISVTMKGFRPDKRIIGGIYKVGVPSIIMQSIVSVMMVGFNMILIGFSEAAVSVLGAYGKLQSFVFMPIFGLCSGLIPIVAYNYGARSPKRITETIKYALILSVSIAAVGIVVFQLFPTQLLAMFNATPVMVDVGGTAFRIISICFPLASVGIVFSSVFQAVGNGVLSMIISICRQLAVILPVAYLLAQVGGLYAVWFAFPIAECVSLVLSLFFFRFVKKRYLQPLEQDKKECITVD